MIMLPSGAPGARIGAQEMRSVERYGAFCRATLWAPRSSATHRAETIDVSVLGLGLRAIFEPRRGTLLNVDLELAHGPSTTLSAVVRRVHRSAVHGSIIGLELHRTTSLFEASVLHLSEPLQRVSFVTVPTAEA